MHKATRDRVYNTLSKNNKVAISVKSGETFVVETQLNGGAIECQAEVTLKAKLLENYKAKKWLRLENEDYIMTIANNDRIKDSFTEGCHELIEWMCEDYGFTPQEAYLLPGQVMEARCTMLHGDDSPFSPYICKIRKQYLKPDKKAIWE